MFNSSKNLRVVDILSESQIVLNAGINDGIEIDEEFIIYGLSEKDIIDPETYENLGKLEIYRGTGKVIYVQSTMCIVQALSTSLISRFQSSLIGESYGEFNNAKVNDYAKPNATLSSSPRD